MKQVYSSALPAEAHLIKGHLEAAGVQAIIQGGELGRAPAVALLLTAGLTLVGPLRLFSHSTNRSNMQHWIRITTLRLDRSQKRAWPIPLTFR